MYVSCPRTKCSTRSRITQISHITRSPIITDHEVRLNITFESATNMAANGVDTSVEPTADLYSTFIYLDSSERKRFSQVCYSFYIAPCTPIHSKPYISLAHSLV
jgi:hypothetical protein